MPVILQKLNNAWPVTDGPALRNSLIWFQNDHSFSWAAFDGNAITAAYSFSCAQKYDNTAFAR